MKKLQKTVTDYNVTYGTQFQVMNPSFSLASIAGEEMLPSLNPYPKTGGVFIFYDRNKDLLAVYSARYFSVGLKTHLKSGMDDTGHWVVKGKWVSDPAYVVFVVGNQDRLYEKDSLRSFLIKELHPRYDEIGNLTR